MILSLNLPVASNDACMSSSGVSYCSSGPWTASRYWVIAVPPGSVTGLLPGLTT